MYKGKKNLLGNVKKFYDEREIIINAFKNKIFPLNYGENHFEDEENDDNRNENNLIN